MNNKHAIAFFAFIIFNIVFSSCEKNTDMSEVDYNLIVGYASEHNLDGEFTSSGLYYVIDEPGSFNHPTINSQVTVSYIGYTLDGAIFDNRDFVTFLLSQVIIGWQEGIQLVGEGGKIKLIIPSGLAYGPSGSGSIGSNKVLVFDITLHYFLD